MTESTGFELLDQYRSITSKLKKRFLRKPNETEASESFAALGQQCESQELPQYAALSWLAAARCEGTLGNPVSETAYLLRAARQFFKAEQEDFLTGCTCVSTENLEVYLVTIMHLKGDYVSALHTYQEITKALQNIPTGSQKCGLLLECEINMVFLLLILRPSPQKISSELTRILEKYTWADQSDSSLIACKMSKKLFLLMQSIVLICQSVDTSSLREIESDFWPFLSVEQKDLLRTLCRIYYP
ncbi:40-kDa huntingtin-associated protein isoform X4 [Anthonomus grandis grandis]|uniref:40-kDa huntingtin-associated protein isoform X4 n=1 Tax=Anthonomus grandis grandis TaxID=2921223 RepID=UPI002165E800|nr:40-kDa huntingtin-associated protein isoform X4 [Anthonomus grandis grandis]